jgi:hypothetical protein
MRSVCYEGVLAAEPSCVAARLSNAKIGPGHLITEVCDMSLGETITSIRLVYENVDFYDQQTTGADCAGRLLGLNFRTVQAHWAVIVSTLRCLAWADGLTRLGGTFGLSSPSFLGLSPRRDSEARYRRTLISFMRTVL